MDYTPTILDILWPLPLKKIALPLVYIQKSVSVRRCSCSCLCGRKRSESELWMIYAVTTSGVTTFIVSCEIYFTCDYHSQCIGPATRCDAAHPRWDILIHLRCCKITCNGLRCIFQHVGNFAPDFGISQLIIVRFSNVLQHSDGYLNRLSCSM